MSPLLLLIALLPLALAQAPAACNAPTTCPAPVAVPVAWYNNTFSAPVSGSNYGYLAADLGGCGHTGLAVTGTGGGNSAGTATGYIDLNAASGPQATTIQLPSPMAWTATSGNPSLGSAGWTFEVTVNITALASVVNWAKLFCMGDGAGIDDIIMGYVSGTQAIDFTLDYTANTTYITGGNIGDGNLHVVTSPNLNINTWYHFAVVLQQYDLTSEFASWYVYVNGVLINNTQPNGIFFAVPSAPRALSYIGRSCYASDALMQAQFDSFRIYNQALNAAQVSNIYAHAMGGCPLLVSNTPTSGASTFPNTIATGSTIPTPYLSYTFTSNVSVATSPATPGYIWLPSVESDAACGLNTVHSGIIELYGGAQPGTPYTIGSFVNLSATSGAYTVGAPVLPVLGGPGLTGNAVSGTQGWSFEFVFKPSMVANWGKLMDLGAIRANEATCNNDISFSNLGDTLQFMNFEICDGLGNGVSTNQFGPFVEGLWYHVVISIQQLPNGNANWVVYANTAVVATVANVYFPLNAVARPNGFLGKSGWGDEYWSGWLDSFNVYTAPFTPAMVYARYAAVMGSSTPLLSCTFTPSTISTIPSSVVYFAATFSTNTTIAGSTYTWQTYGTNDSPALNAIYQGVVVLNGCTPGSCAGNYVNLSASTGPSSIGQTIGPVGGMGTGGVVDSTMGWSFEFTFKSYVSTTWAKLMDLGDGMGSGNYEILYGWHDADPFYTVTSIFSNQEDFNSGVATAQDDMPISNYVMPLNVWQHAVIVMQYDSILSQTAGVPNDNINDGSVQFATYYCYMNGVLVMNQTGHLYPPLATRINSGLGRSNYGDDFWMGEIDTFRVYSIALNSNQVSTLYNASVTPIRSAASSTGAAGVSSSSSSASIVASSSSTAGSVSGSATTSSASNVGSSSLLPTAAVPSSSGSSTIINTGGTAGGAGAASSSSSGLGSGAIAGIIIGIIFGVILLLGICFFICYGRKGKNSSSRLPYAPQGGETDYVENSHVGDQSHISPDEVEMA